MFCLFIPTFIFLNIGLENEKHPKVYLKMMYMDTRDREDRDLHVLLTW